MTTRRIILGKNSAGVPGLYVAPPGLDAYTATDAQLLMNMNQFTQQMLLFGTTTSIPTGGTTVVFGYTNVPFVLLTGTGLSISLATGGTAVTSTFTNVSGMFIRPYPPIGSAGKSIRGAVSAASMLITCPGQQTSVAAYAVFRQALQ